MKTSQKGIDLICEFEGFRSYPYLDAVGIPTIGYGATHYLDGKKVTMNDMPLTEKEAKTLLSNMLLTYERPVNEMCPLVNQNQFDALVSFTYNLGAGNLKRSGIPEETMKDANSPEIGRIMKLYCNAGGKPLAGLIRRRQAECDLYYTPVAPIEPVEPSKTAEVKMTPIPQIEDAQTVSLLQKILELYKVLFSLLKK